MSPVGAGEPPAGSVLRASRWCPAGTDRPPRRSAVADHAERDRRLARQPPQLVLLPGGQRRQVVDQDVAGRAVVDHPGRGLGPLPVEPGWPPGRAVEVGGQLGQVDEVVRTVVAVTATRRRPPGRRPRRCRRRPTRRPEVRAGAPAGRRPAAAGGGAPRRGGHDRQRGGDAGGAGLGGDALPHHGRRRLVVGEGGQGGPVQVDLGGARGARRQVGLDRWPVLAVERAEGVDGQLVVRVAGVTGSPRRLRGRRSWWSPARMRLLTVPSGCPEQRGGVAVAVPAEAGEARWGPARPGARGSSARRTWAARRRPPRRRPRRRPCPGRGGPAGPPPIVPPPAGLLRPHDVHATAVGPGE